MKFDLVSLRPGEQFAPIPNYDRYLIGNRGTVFSTIRRGRFLKATIGSHGYPYVSLMADGASTPSKHLVHRLVAQAFVSNPQRKPVVNHMDGNKTNPRAENLEWVSFADNNDHARRSGLNRAFGSDHYATHLSGDDILAIRRRAASGEFHREIADEYGIVRQQVTKIVNRQAWGPIA